jgi:autotransporter passenger strand-loop-strand repeat protein
MTVESGGQQYIGSGGTALATDIAAGGAEVIFGSDSGAMATGTQYVFGVASGGTTFGAGFSAFRHGNGSGVSPADGGSQQVESGGTAIGMTLSEGGEQYVGAGGTAIGTDFVSYAAEGGHGTPRGTIAGTQYVDGLASGTVVGTGGYQVVNSGGTISAAGISGGTIELQSGASDGAAPITFTGAGELILDASASFAGTVAGFGSASLNDTIDFADIPFVASGAAGTTTVAWTQLTSGANASGTLQVSGGGHSADITLLGQYLVGNFTASSDNHGGTLVTDPPVTAATDPNPLILTPTQRMA